MPSRTASVIQVHILVSASLLFGDVVTQLRPFAYDVGMGS